VRREGCAPARLKRRWRRVGAPQTFKSGTGLRACHMQAVRVAGRVAGKATTACAPVQRRRHITVGALATSGDVVLVQNDTPVPCEYSSSTVWLAASPRGKNTKSKPKP
jgi:hypothetical protein